MSADLAPQLAEEVRAALGGAILDSVIAYEELTILVDAARIVEVVSRLRDDPVHLRCRQVHLFGDLGLFPAFDEMAHQHRMHLPHRREIVTQLAHALPPAACRFTR